MAIIDVSAAYAMSYANGEIASRCDSGKLEELLKAQFSNATISSYNGYDDFFTILLDPVDFTDYVQASVSAYAYETLEDGSIHLTAYNGSEADVSIPAEVDGKRVASLGMASDGTAFSWKTSPVSVHVPDGVNILDNAFQNCTDLTSVRLPEDLPAISSGAFHSCSALTTLDIPDSVTAVGDAAFYGCSSLDGITLPQNLTSIGREAFYGCSSLTHLDLPSGISSIGARAFYGCTALTGD